jgi:predicted TIM-barrel fold metal-dependent hydrolase
VSCDPDERSIPPLAERYGDRFLWASDFPHADHPPDYIPNLAEMAVGFPEARRRAFLGDQVRELFDIPAEARAVAAA